MPIDQQLQNLEDLPSKGKENKLQAKSTTLNLPINKLAKLLQEFELIGKEIKPHAYIDVFTVDILPKLYRFKPHHEFYLGVTENLEILCNDLDNWKTSFDKISPIQGNDIAMPTSLYEWVIEKVDATYTNIRLSSDVYTDSSTPDLWFTELCSRIDNISSDLKNTQNLVQVVCLGSALNTLVNKLSGQFNLIGGHKINTSNFIKYLSNLENFSQGRTFLRLDTHCDYNMKSIDQTPNPPKSIFKYFKW